MADADEGAGGGVLNADPTHVVQTRGARGARERGAAEREVNPAELEASRVPVARSREVDALRLEEDVRARLRAGLLAGRAGRDADAAEQVLVGVVGQDADLVERVVEALVGGARRGSRVRPVAEVDLRARVPVAAPHGDPGLDRGGGVGEEAERIVVAEGLAAVASELERRSVAGDERRAADRRSGRLPEALRGRRRGDELAEEGLRRRGEGQT